MKATNDILSRIVESGPSQGTFLLVLNKMKQEGRLKEVIQGCLRALDIYPDDIRLRHLLAEAYLQVGFIGQAEAQLERVTSDIHNLASSYKLQAKVYIRQNRLKDAFEALSIYLVHQPADEEANKLLHDIRASVHIEKTTFPDTSIAEELFEREEAETPDLHYESGEREVLEFSGVATPTLAEIYYNQGQIKEAIATYEKVLSNNPNDQNSRQRLLEIRSIIEEDELLQPAGDKNELIRKKEKLIAVLEGWLPRIQKLYHD